MKNFKFGLQYFKQFNEVLEEFLPGKYIILEEFLSGKRIRRKLKVAADEKALKEMATRGLSDGWIEQCCNFMWFQIANFVGGY